MIPDRELIEGYLADGDEQLLRALFDRYLKQIYGFLIRFVGSVHDAEDLTQETMVKAWQHLKRFDPERSFKTWVFTIARRTGVDWLRKRRTVPFSAFEDELGGNPLIDTLEDDGELPDELLERKDAAEALRAVLAEVPPGHREVLILRHEQEMSFQEIGEILGEPLNTVKSRYRRGLLLLRKRMQDGVSAPKPG